jgi:hypothetical protein
LNLLLVQDPDHRGKGTSGGIFQNQTYFSCRTDCALFVSLEKLWFEPKSVGMQGELQNQLQLGNRQQSVNKFKPASYAAVTSSPSHHSQPPHGQSTLDIGRTDMRRQRSLQPQCHVYDTIPGATGNDSMNIHRRLGNQGKPSSVAMAEGCSETFQIETPSHVTIPGARISTMEQHRLLLGPDCGCIQVSCKRSSIM